jgi:hypothetical protein
MLVEHKKFGESNHNHDSYIMVLKMDVFGEDPWRERILEDLGSLF